MIGRAFSADWRALVRCELCSCLIDGAAVAATMSGGVRTARAEGTTRVVSEQGFGSGDSFFTDVGHISARWGWSQTGLPSQSEWSGFTESWRK